MTGVLIADTVLGSGDASPSLKLREAIAHYLERHRQEPLVSLEVPEEFVDADWGQLWQDYGWLYEGDQPVLIATGHSFGGNWDELTTVADWCRDWRMGAILMVPLHPDSVSNAISIAVAYAALAAQSKATLLGVVLWSESRSGLEKEAIDQVSQAIVQTARCGVLGHLYGDELGTPEEKAVAASGLNWEMLPWR